jgi:hypothetical protein
VTFVLEVLCLLAVAGQIFVWLLLPVGTIWTWCKALRAGMVRARPGHSVRFSTSAGGPYRDALHLVVTTPNRAPIRIPASAIERAEFVCDDLFERTGGIAALLTLHLADGRSVGVPETADGFSELYRWVSANVAVEWHHVTLSTPF